MTNRINATFTTETFTTKTEAIISTIDENDIYTEIARIAVTDLGTLAAADEDQDDIINGLNDYVDAFAATLGKTIISQDGEGDNLFWTLSA